MQIEFIQQETPEAITVGDKIELYNCEDHGMNGNYTVANINPLTLGITLVGSGKLSGFVTMIHITDEEE